MATLSSFPVCRNGHIILLPSTRSRLIKYSSPRPLLSVSRSYPIVAGFWANAKPCVLKSKRVLVTSPLRRRRRRRRRRTRTRRYWRTQRYWYCPGSVSYGQSKSRALRTQVRNLVNDYGFFPSSVLWATYSPMYSCYGTQVHCIPGC